MRDDDLIYYRGRAEAELRQAQEATAPEAAKAHCDLANAYLERVAGAEPYSVRI